MIVTSSHQIKSNKLHIFLFFDILNPPKSLTKPRRRDGKHLKENKFQRCLEKANSVCYKCKGFMET